MLTRTLRPIRNIEPGLAREAPLSISPPRAQHGNQHDRERDNHEKDIFGAEQLIVLTTAYAIDACSRPLT